MDDKKVIEIIHKILANGNNAEVRMQNGNIVVYEVKKKKYGA